MSKTERMQRYFFGEEKESRGYWHCMLLWIGSSYLIITKFEARLKDTLGKPCANFEANWITGVARASGTRTKFDFELFINFNRWR